jgi:hypothetical protein
MTGMPARRSDGTIEAISDETKAAIVALHAAKPGLKAAALGKVLGVSAGSVSNVLKAARKTAMAAQEAAAVLPEVDAEPPAPVTLQAVVERLRAEVPRLEALAEAARRSGDLKGYAMYVRQRTDLLDRLAEHEKPSGPDPELDPLNVEARSTLVRKIREIVEREEAGQRQAAPLKAMMAGR